MTDYADWQTPAAHAQQISITGVPLLHNASSLSNQTVNLVTIPSTQTRGPFTVGQICYELWLSVENQAASATGTYITVEMQWTDSATSLLLARRKFKVVAGPLGSPHTLKISGPVHADTVKLIFGITSDSASTCQVIYQLLGTSRLYGRDTMRSTQPTAEGFTIPGAVPEYSVLINTAPTVAAGNTLTRLMAAYSGRVWINAHTNSGTTNMVVIVHEAFTTAPVLANFQQVFTLHSDANGNINEFIDLPGVQCAIDLTNNGAASQVLSLLMCLEDALP